MTSDLARLALMLALLTGSVFVMRIVKQGKALPLGSLPPVFPQWAHSRWVRLLIIIAVLAALVAMMRYYVPR
ncbi:MAG TPA: hypothetical protein VLZ51_02365, partial [Brevundimonas sp.]|nr:hypothetical protein [Brevundimonas sp.]